MCVDTPSEADVRRRRSGWGHVCAGGSRDLCTTDKHCISRLWYKTKLVVAAPIRKSVLVPQVGPQHTVSGSVVRCGVCVGALGVLAVCSMMLVWSGVYRLRVHMDHRNVCDGV